MIKFIRKPLEQSFKSFFDATIEPPFSADEMVATMRPVLQKYFIGIFEETENVIMCKFFNNQLFKITVEEIKDNANKEDTL